MWVVLLLLPWRPWSTAEQVNAADRTRDASEAVGSLTALIPARNEADGIGKTIAALAAEQRSGVPLSVIVVDDQSSDSTADVASQAAHEHGLEKFSVLQGAELPEGWSGKLWALEQGRQRVQTPLVLLIDADIVLRSGIISALYRKMACGAYGFVSVMAALRMESLWERLLLPPFIYFFKLIYPFGLANGPSPWFSAGAGGCILMRADVLAAIGGFSALKGAIIDDCTLARLVKKRGHGTWIGLSRDVVSLRRYETLDTVWNMVARTAFTQLRYSVLLLLACTVLMATAFGGPLLAMIGSKSLPVVFVATLGVSAMIISFLPTLRYYGQPAWWSITLPLAAFLYLLMTYHSAFRYWRGERSRWKGRTYSK